MSRYIDADALIERWNNMSVRGRTEFDQEIMVAPSIDIVFCKECTERDDDWCMYFGNIINPDDFCSYGERREP